MLIAVYILSSLIIIAALIKSALSVLDLIKINKYLKGRK